MPSRRAGGGALASRCARAAAASDDRAARAAPNRPTPRGFHRLASRGVGGGGFRGCRYGDQASLVSTSKDNTGERTYVEGMVFPTLAFPSDHGITTVDLLLM